MEGSGRSRECLTESLLKHLHKYKDIGFENQYRELKDLIHHTVSTGGSNSVLVLGPRGVGKSILVRKVVEDIRHTSEIFRADGLVVHLNGLLHTDDRLALKAIAKQLHLENVVGDKVFGSFAEHLEFLLKSLNSGGRQSKPIVFLLEEFALFCSHHNQTLLYNLFDVAQSRAAPIIVVGITAELDVVESLEKRVRSRFNHRQITLYPTDKFPLYFELVKKALIIDEGNFNGWNSHATKVLSQRSVEKLFEEIFFISNAYAFLKQFLVQVISRMDYDHEGFHEQLLKSIWSDIRTPSEQRVLGGLTVLEMCMLIGCKQVKQVYEDEPFNFEMAYHEFDKFASHKAKEFKFDRPVMAKAWETLVELELVTPVERASKTLKQYKLYELQVMPERIASAVESMPLPVKDWALATFASV